MAIVRPFRGLRPKPAYAAQVASPPYDVLSSDEARELVKENPNSFLRVNKSEVDFPADVSIYSDEVYQKGRANLQRLVNEGLMFRDPMPCFYIYRLTMSGQSQTGLATLTSVEEYDNGIIKKHEHTRPEKVSDRARHIVTLEAQVGPVFSIYHRNSSLKKLLNGVTSRGPEIDFVADDNIRHELWVVSDEQTIAKIVENFAAMEALYIADGHHRSEAASEVCRQMKSANPKHTGKEPYNFFLNVIFSDDELRILPYNRVVKDFNGHSPEKILSQAERHFDISPISLPDSHKPHDIGLYMDKKWHLLTVKKGSYDASHPVESIDSAILTKNLLSPILGIENLRTDKRIDFVGGIRGIGELVRLVDSNKFKIAFSLSPVRVEQLLQVADAGEVMPPKSTWFEPKLRDGVVVNLLNE